MSNHKEHTATDEYQYPNRKEQLEEYSDELRTLLAPYPHDSRADFMNKLTIMVLAA